MNRSRQRSSLLKSKAQIHRAWKIYFTRLSGPALSVCSLRLRRETVESSREEFRTMKHRSSGYMLQLLKHRRSSNANCKVWISMWKRNGNTNPIWACCWKVIYIRMIKYKNKCIGNECNRVSNLIFLFWNFVCIAFNVHAIVWESKIYCTRELGHAQNLKPSHVYLTN